MLPFSDMVNLFANELARLRGGGPPLFGVAARPFHCLGVIIIFGHETSFWQWRLPSISTLRAMTA